MSYERPPGAVNTDFVAAREFEEHVAEVLAAQGHNTHTRFSAKDDLDIWVPGFYLEVKEKRQPLTDRWHLMPGIPGEDLFILDELSVRRMVRHWPHVYVLVRDLPRERLYLAGIWELITFDKVRVDRGNKGKWIMNLQEWKELEGIEQVAEIANVELPQNPWKSPACIGTVRQV